MPLPFKEIDYKEVYRLAQEQSVTGLVAAGLEHVTDAIVPNDVALQLAGQALQTEQRNIAMNEFVASLIESMRKQGIYALLLKGQGVAQCYERPLWRSCGDVDLFLSEDNYNKAELFCSRIASRDGEVEEFRKHHPYTIDNWEVELHGNLRVGLWGSVDKTLDKVQYDVFCGGSVRSWFNGKTQVFLLGADEDIVFSFAHILQHLFKYGVGLRQVCDWCRLLWHYHDSLNLSLLEQRLQMMGVMSEWKAFAYLVVSELGFPEDLMPFYMNSNKCKRKSKRLLSAIFESGNFGHNKDFSYLRDYKTVRRKAKTLWSITQTNARLFSIFPYDAIRAWAFFFFSRLKLSLKSI